LELPPCQDLFSALTQSWRSSAARAPAWGLRRLEGISNFAAGFARPEIIEMPANNLVVIYRRQPAPVDRYWLGLKP